MILLIEIGEHDTDYTTHCKEPYQLNFLFLGKSNLNFCMAQNKLYCTSSYKMSLVNKKTELYSRPISQKKKGMWCTDAQPIKPSKMNYRQKMVASFMYSKI